VKPELKRMRIETELMELCTPSDLADEVTRRESELLGHAISIPIIIPPLIHTHLSVCN
jgi:hypothetical protein